MSRNIQLLISEEFAEKIIPEDDSVRLADELIDKMDLSCLFNTYSHNGRKYATNPRTLFKILVYANMQGIYSSIIYIFYQKNFDKENDNEITDAHDKKTSYKNLICSQCRIGEESYSLDRHSEACIYMGCWKENECRYFTPIEIHENKQ